MRSLTSLILILLVLQGLPASVEGGEFQVKTFGTDRTRASSIDPILMMNDSSFEQNALEMGWEGNGSEEDPYIISDLVIDANRTGYGIAINTSFSFIIRNCTVMKADGGGSPIGGITILSGNGTITGCTVNSSGYGIRALDTCRIINNTIFDCHNGLWLYSDGMTVIGNNVIDGKNHAIHYGGNNSLFMDNTVDNWDFGIYLIGSHNNRIENNSMTNIDDHGIRLDWSHNNTVIGNYAAHNDDGVFLKYGSSGNRILNNTVEDCEEGLYVFDGNFNEFYGNMMFNCSFFLEMIRDNFATQIIPENNTVGGKPIYFIGSKDYGGWVVPLVVGQWIVWEASNLSIYYSDINGGTAAIILFDCTRTLINKSRISDQVYYGVLADSCDNITVTNTTISEVGIAGVHFHECRDVQITEDEFTNGTDSISLSKVEGSFVSGCIIFNGNDGVRILEECENITVSDNEISGSFFRGIAVYSDECIISRNNIHSIDTSTSGIYVKGWGCIIEDNDIIDVKKGLEFDSYSRYGSAYGTQISGCEKGIMSSGSYTNISDNRISDINGGFGIVDSGSTNMIMENRIEDDGDPGILLERYASSKVYSNELIHTSIDLYGIGPSSVIEIPENNTVDGKPVRFYNGLSLEGAEIEKDGGQYILLNCVDGVIEDMKMDTGSINVLLFRSRDLLIRNCSFTSYNIGISGYNSWRVTFMDSDFHDLNFGILANGDRSWEIKDCRFHDISKTSVNLSNMRDCTIDSCLFNGTREGLSLLGTDDSMIIKNMFQEGDRGIILDIDSESNRILNNGFMENGDIPISVLSGLFNRIESNAFVNNGRFITHPVDLYINEKTTKVLNNYYWNHTSPDLDHDGKVDLPYDMIPGKGNLSDIEPSVDLPYEILGSPTGPDSEQFMERVIISWSPPTSVHPFAPVLGYTVRRIGGGDTKPTSWVLGPVEAFIDNDPGQENEVLYSVQARSVLGEGSPVYEIALLNMAPLGVFFEMENGEILNSREVNISWTSTLDWTDITHVELYLDNEVVPLNGTPRERTIELDEMGWHDLSVKIRDNRGFNATGSTSFYSDWEAPKVKLIPQMNWTNDLAEFVWNSTDNMEVVSTWYEVWNMTDLSLEEIADYDLGKYYPPHRITRNGAVPPPPSPPFERVMKVQVPDGQNNISIELPEGNFLFVIIVYDLSGNSAIDQIPIGVDRTSPRIISFYPTGDSVGYDEDVTIEVSEPLAPSSIFFDLTGLQGDWIESSNNTYRFIVDGELGDNSEYHIIFYGEDLAGNPISASWSFKTAKDPSRTTTTVGRVTNEKGNPLDGSEISINGTDVVFSDPNGTFTMELSEGSYEISFFKEGYGNVSVIIEVPYGGGPFDIGSIELQSIDDNKEKEDPPYLMFILGIALILLTIFIAISAFTRKGGPLEEE